jgi:hypothetical protein
MVLSLEDAVTILNKWKDDSAHILVVSESGMEHCARMALAPVAYDLTLPP